MEVVDHWTARHACAFQSALRLTQDELATSLGVARRTVATWHEKPDVVLRPEFQRALDTAYERASDQEKARFARQLRVFAPGERPPGPDGMPASPEVIAVHAMRGLIPRPAWNDLLRRARRHVWLYGMAELGFALDDEVPSILRDATGGGADVRILLLDPNYVGLAGIDSDEGSPTGTLTARIRAAIARFGQMRQECGPGMGIRVYAAPPSTSIVRGDDRMMVTPYLRFFVGGNSPTLELQDTATGKMFDRYCRHFENTWNLAEDWTG